MKKVVEWIAIILLIAACFVCNPWPAQDSDWTAHDEGKEYAWFDQDGQYHYRWTVYWLSTETGTPEQVIAEHFEGASQGLFFLREHIFAFITILLMKK